MALRNILTDQEPALHKVCKKVENFDAKLHRLLDDMKDTLIESGGVVLRTAVDSISISGRDTQGVIIMRIEEGNQLVSLERVEAIAEEEAQA